MQSSARKLSASLVVAVIATCFTAVASAKDNDPYQKQTEVSYSDLDLAQVADAKTLYSRIRHAARDVCRAEVGVTSRTSRIENKCFAQAVEDAVHSVSDPNLTAVFLAHAGKRSMVASNR
jgi:UrcA family protein